MSSEADIPQDLKQLEAALRSLIPAAARLDRDRLMYEAGQAAALSQAMPPPLSQPDRCQPHEAHSPLSPSRHSPPATSHSSWIWPGITAGMTTVAATLLVLLLSRPEPRMTERIVYLPQPVTAVPAEGGVEGTSLPGDQRPSIQQPASDQARQALTGGWIGLSTPARRPEYLGLRDQVLALGVETWQKPSRGASQPAQATSNRQTLDSLLAPSGDSATSSTPQPSREDGAQL